MTERDQQGTIDDPEVPEEDALEQRLDAAADEDPDSDEDEPDPEALAVEADPADVAEQSRSVDLDDDEYR
jgi:hypothetical protein